MLAFAGDWEQIEFLPTASKIDIKMAKSYLSRYRRMKLIVEDFERKGIADPKQQLLYDNGKRLVDLVNRAVKLIIDDEIRELVELRYLSGKPRYYVVAHYHIMDPSTIDRKINKGIDSVANTMLLWT